MEGGSENDEPLPSARGNSNGLTNAAARPGSGRSCSSDRQSTPQLRALSSSLTRRQKITETYHLEGGDDSSHSTGLSGLDRVVGGVRSIFPLVEVTPSPDVEAEKGHETSMTPHEQETYPTEGLDQQRRSSASKNSSVTAATPSLNEEGLDPAAPEHHHDKHARCAEPKQTRTDVTIIKSSHRALASADASRRRSRYGCIAEPGAREVTSASLSPQEIVSWEQRRRSTKYATEVIHPDDEAGTPVGSEFSSQQLRRDSHGAETGSRGTAASAASSRRPSQRRSSKETSSPWNDAQRMEPHEERVLSASLRRTSTSSTRHRRYSRTSHHPSYVDKTSVPSSRRSSARPKSTASSHMASSLRRQQLHEKYAIAIEALEVAERSYTSSRWQHLTDPSGFEPTKHENPPASETEELVREPRRRSHVDMAHPERRRHTSILQFQPQESDSDEAVHERPFLSDPSLHRDKNADGSAGATALASHSSSNLNGVGHEQESSSHVSLSESDSLDSQPQSAAASQKSREKKRRSTAAVEAWSTFSSQPLDDYDGRGSKPGGSGSSEEEYSISCYDVSCQTSQRLLEPLLEKMASATRQEGAKSTRGTSASATRLSSARNSGAVVQRQTPLSSVDGRNNTTNPHCMGENAWRCGSGMCSTCHPSRRKEVPSPRGSLGYSPPSRRLERQGTRDGSANGSSPPLPALPPSRQVALSRSQQQQRPVASANSNRVPPPPPPLLRYPAARPYLTAPPRQRRVGSRERRAGQQHGHRRTARRQETPPEDAFSSTYNGSAYTRTLYSYYNQGQSLRRAQATYRYCDMDSQQMMLHCGVCTDVTLPEYNDTLHGKPLIRSSESSTTEEGAASGGEMTSAAAQHRHQAADGTERSHSHHAEHYTKKSSHLVPINASTTSEDGVLVYNGEKYYHRRLMQDCVALPCE